MNSSSQQETNTSVCLDSSPRRPRLRNPHAGLLAAAHFTEADDCSLLCMSYSVVLYLLNFSLLSKKKKDGGKQPTSNLIGLL